MFVDKLFCFFRGEGGKKTDFFFYSKIGFFRCMGGFPPIRGRIFRGILNFCPKGKMSFG